MRFYVLTLDGEDVVESFIKDFAALPERQRLQQWFMAAEDCANAVGPNDAVVLEMPEHQTISGRPAALTIDRRCFMCVDPAVRDAGC